MSLAPRSALLAAALLSASPALATVIVPRTIEEMARESACVVRGRVLDQSAAWDEKHQRIYTTTEIQVVEVVHGLDRAPDRIQVRTLGGEVGKVGMKVAGTERFTLNEEVFLFLRADPVSKSAYQVVGMSQGKFRLEAEAKGRVVAVPNVEGLAFARPDPATGTLRVDGHAEGPGAPIPLVDLKARVIAAVTQSTPAAPPAPALNPAPTQDRPIDVR